MIQCISKYLGIVWLFFAAFSAGTASAAGERRFTLVIDAGHGGHDAGACGAFSKEKNINLNVALAFGKLVETNCPDVRVIYTRRRDVFIPLQERADIANRNKADLFISIHTNALPAGKIAYGPETYTLGMARAAANLEVAKRENSVITYESNYKQVYEGFDPGKAESYIIFEIMQDKYMKQSVELARSIQKQYVSHAGRRNKGVHQAGFLVLRHTTMPSVLTELGFISTPEEERYLNSSEGIRALGQSIYNGFLEYRRAHDVTAVAFPPSIPREETPVPVSPAEPQPLPEEPRPELPAVPQSGTETPENRNVREEEKERGPVFKVQLFVSDRKLRTGDSRLKGLSGTDFYVDKGMYKYTVGSSTDYTEIRQLRKEVADRFPDSFVVAFENGERVELQQAIRKSRKK